MASPPQHLMTDYLEIGYIATIILVGTPLNIIVFYQQLVRYSGLVKSNKFDLNTAFVFQKLHLNFANLMILLLHCPAQMGWLISYQWLAGDFVCKFIQFVWMLSFVISSNIVAVIGLDRLRNVLKMEAMWSGNGATNVVPLGSAVLRPVKVKWTN